jgi:hypothetical protein
MTAPLTVPIEIYQTAENKLLVIRKDPRGGTAEAVNGATGWIKDASRRREMNDKELTAARLDADFFRYMKIKASYPQMRTLGRESLGSREVYVVGASSREGSREKLYFDAQTRLLVRKYVAFNTAFGTIPEVTDFDDYRDVNGVKLPFMTTWSRPPFMSTRKFAEIRINVELIDARFQLPN